MAQVAAPNPLPSPYFLSPLDVLYHYCYFLKRRAMELSKDDAIAVAGWFDEAAVLLAHVPSLVQRELWAAQLAMSINLLDVPLPAVIRELLRPREGVQ